MKWIDSICNTLQLIFVEGETVPLMVIKSDGGFTYDTSDLAAVHHRYLIYV